MYLKQVSVSELENHDEVTGLAWGEEDVFRKRVTLYHELHAESDSS